MSYNTQKAIKTYNITKEQGEIAQKAFENLNTEVGYKAYYDLAKDLIQNNQDASILCDLSADFDWDAKLVNAIEKLEKQFGKLSGDKK